MNWGESHPQWRGDAATLGSKRARARRRFPLGPCERCGEQATDRHHIDGDPGNNVAENIAILCRRCHHEADGRVEGMRMRAAAQARVQAERTHCPKGHPYDEANTYRHGNHRYCRTCNRESKRAYQ